MTTKVTTEITIEISEIKDLIITELDLEGQDDVEVKFNTHIEYPDGEGTEVGILKNITVTYTEGK